MKCVICGGLVKDLLVLNSKQTVTSLGRLINANATVYSCPTCGHCQTKPDIDLNSYYKNDYKTLSASEEEDDVYEVVDGTVTYRAEHMVKVFSRKIAKYVNTACSSIELLDYGCGKSLFCQRLRGLNSNIKLHLFDVSSDYTDFWIKFCSRDNFATFEIPSSWIGKFEIVASLFSLEHVPDTLGSLRQIKKLLKPDGILYLVVPNMFSENTADMIVVDHLHHYSPESMAMALHLSGFALLEADHDSHRQCSIYICANTESVSDIVSNHIDIESRFNQMEKIALDWRKIITSIQADMSYFNDESSLVIVGAGILGSLVVSLINNKNSIVGFIDSNKHKQLKGWLSYPVYPPRYVPNPIHKQDYVYIFALNSKLYPTVGMQLIPLGVSEANVIFPFGG